MTKINEIRGITVLNPVDIEEKYLLKTIEYAHEKNYNHLEIVGSIHNFKHGNIDGMTYYKKYSRYNAEKDSSYIDMCLNATNKCLELAEKYGVKTYIWHHELDLPTDFGNDYPEILNENNDIEVTHPLVKDFLVNKLKDFFESYPKMTGVILTLHETKVPLLKLKNQKLDKKERLKYVIGILYNTCQELGKELIVRSFASIAEDSSMMLEAVSEVSKDMIVMDKWTQFDWPITLPPNEFLKRIKNPLLIETDISGEYWGKNRLPSMMKKHILERFVFCDKIDSVGYVHRIDRNGQILFDTLNEVNLEIVDAKMNDKNVEESIDNFFKNEYSTAWKEVKKLADPTEELIKKLLHNKGYYFMQGSYFPDLNHAKNHFFFEMMRENYSIVSNEWFVSKNWNRGTVQDLIDEKEEVCVKSEELLKNVIELKNNLNADKYDNLLLFYKNLFYCAKLWKTLVFVLINYVKYFETNDEQYINLFFDCVEELKNIDNEARESINDKNYYCNYGHFTLSPSCHIVQEFSEEVLQSFNIEKATWLKLQKENLYDFIICGGGFEGHNLRKEVNFSDTLISDNKLCRIPGNKAGGKWSRINGHGWFSYELNIKPNEENIIEFEIGALGDKVGLNVQIDNKTYQINKEISGVITEQIKYKSSENESKITIRFDRTCEITPLVYIIKVR